MPTILLSRPSGRLSDSTLIKILKRPEAWSALSGEQQEDLYGLLPHLCDPRSEQPLEIDTSIHPMEHPVYGEAVKQFTAYIEKQIANGADKKSWQDEARNATLKRAEGAYDQSKEIDREEYWGQKAVPTFMTETQTTKTSDNRDQLSDTK
ncbi:hypothetical protein ANO11243_017180 [Dothideomycetidae sp. 11243]|nr:hypothetical protein ANO11243_017180 [fungal sp. No.11243]